MKNILLILGIAATGLFWACGDGTIATKTGDDEIALLNYGEFNPEGMKGLVGDALKACQEDPKCAEAMERAGVVSSSSDSTSTDSLTSGSSAGANSAGSSGAASAGSSGAGGSSSAGAAGSSSSGAVSSSSGSVVSSSTVASSSSLATKIAGTCSAPVNPFNGLQKNVETTWSFTNSTPNLTPETYDWTFDEGASIALSPDAAPKVSYSIGGTHKATLIVNKGKDSESAPIPCTAITVVGTRASGCECTTTTAGTIDVSKDNPQTVTWTVSGCSTSDGSELTYTWEEGVTANGTSATKSISTGGTHAPKVTVTAESDTVVTCQAVTATAPATANCYLAGGENDHWNQHGEHPHSTAPGGSFYFAPVDVEGSTEAGISMDVTVGDGTPKTINVKWGGASPATQLTAPSQEGEFPVTLSHNGREVCSAMLTVAYPKITSTGCKLSGNYFQLGSFSGWDASSVGQDIKVTMYLNNDIVKENLNINAYYNNPNWYQVTLPTVVGNYTYRLDYHGNTVCSVPYNVELQKPACYVGANTSVGSSSSYTAIPGQTFYFKPGNSNIPSAKDMSLSFNNGTQTINVKPTSNSSTQLEAPTALTTYPTTYPITLLDNGETMCTASLKVDYPRPACNIGATSNPSSESYTAIPGQTVYFKPGNTSFSGQIDMTYTFNGSTEDITLLPSNNTAISLTAPEAPDTYPVTLKYGTNQACAASLKVAYPKPSCYVGKSSNPTQLSYTATPGQTIYFKPGNSDFTGSLNVTLNFNNNTDNVTLLPSGNSPKELLAPDVLGEYPITLSHNGNTICSATLTVAEEAGADCNYPVGCENPVTSGSFAADGRCYFVTSVSYINLEKSYTVNGKTLSGYKASGDMPAKIDGGYYIKTQNGGNWGSSVTLGEPTCN